MTLLTPILPKLYSDPAVAYAELTAALQPGERYQQEFDYSVIEVPAAVTSKYLELILPNSPVLTEDKDLDSWEITQGGFSICGSFGSICAFASVPRHLLVALENAIFPLIVSPHSLYFVRVVDPANPSTTKWVAIDSKMPVSSTGKLLFSTTSNGQSLVQTLLLKAQATMRGGSFDELSNSRKFNIPFPGWFPHTKVDCNSFEQYCDAMDFGTLANFTFAQTKDSAGNPVTIPGIKIAHDFALCDYIKGHCLVRVENPYGLGATDFENPYSDDSPFWAEHPELADKLAQSRQGGGNWWQSWDSLMAMASGGQIKLRKWTGAL